MHSVREFVARRPQAPQRLRRVKGRAHRIKLGAQGVLLLLAIRGMTQYSGRTAKADLGFGGSNRMSKGPPCLKPRQEKQHFGHKPSDYLDVDMSRL